MLRLDNVRERIRPVKSGFWTGFSFGLGYFLFGLYWVGSAFIARGETFIFVMPFAVALFCTGFALFWAVGGALYVKLSNTSAWRAGLFASILFLVEFARGHIFGGFPWNLPGYIFAAGNPVSQFASTVGIYGLSALVLFLSAAFALFISERKWFPFAMSATCLLGVFIYGLLKLSAAPIDKIQYVKNVHLRIVHANIPQRDKFDPSKYVQTANHYLRLSTSEGFEDVTHIIWPEGAITGLMLEDTGLMQAVDQLMRSKPGEPPVLIVQALRAERRTDQNNPDYYNAATAISFPKNKPMQVSAFYDKQRLVPFGEFIPGGDFAKKLGLSALSSALTGMRAGQNGDVPTIQGLPPMSIQICYEIIFPGFTPKVLTPSGQRPEWILNLSNDSWYGNSSGPRQHVNQARYRAIEQGLPIVRSTSGGISGIIDPYGRQLRQKTLGEDGVLDVRLPRPAVKTIYNSHIDFILMMLIISTLLGSYISIRRSHTLHSA